MGCPPSGLQCGHFRSSVWTPLLHTDLGLPFFSGTILKCGQLGEAARFWTEEECEGTAATELIQEACYRLQRIRASFTRVHSYCSPQRTCPENPALSCYACHRGVRGDALNSMIFIRLQMFLVRHRSCVGLSIQRLLMQCTMYYSTEAYAVVLPNVRRNSLVGHFSRVCGFPGDMGRRNSSDSADGSGVLAAFWSCVTCTCIELLV